MSATKDIHAGTHEQDIFIRLASSNTFHLQTMYKPYNRSLQVIPDRDLLLSVYTWPKGMKLLPSENPIRVAFLFRCKQPYVATGYEAVSYMADVVHQKNKELES